MFKDVDMVYSLFLYNMNKRLAYLNPLSITLIVLSFLPFGFIIFLSMIASGIIIKATLFAIYVIRGKKIKLRDILYDDYVFIDSTTKDFIIINRKSLDENMPENIITLLSKAEKILLFI